jgi:hypothetical protein
MESPMTMTTIHAWPTAVSPPVPDRMLARYPAASQPPQPHTAAELDWLIQMLRASRAETIAMAAIPLRPVPPSRWPRLDRRRLLASALDI